MRRLVLLLLFLPFQVSSINPSEIRSLYKLASNEEVSCKKLLTILGPYNESNNPLFAGYKACATMMMANYLFNPFSKLNSFSEGRELLEKCIKKDNKNIELRFLRFCIQTNAPGFLGYFGSINQDKIFLISSIKSIKDTELKGMISKYLLNSDNLTTLEKKALKL